MNQDEEIPTRVTRGALRRRSVDQEATPQKPSGAASTGTPKKTNSTTKRVNALNPIQESEGRPSTPIAGRSTRRRMSETIDTPTTLPNKLVQNLKETEKSSDSGRRSRNASLTEENLNELNVAYEGSSGMLSTRSRTPARIRASHETLATTGSPATVIPAVRRSTRRNSVTSDDGNISVQSLPVTTSKLSSGLRVLKDDTILEEDASEDRAGSVSSEPPMRQMRYRSSTSASPRSTAASPVLVAKHESTPPRISTTPRVAITPLSLPKTSPRSKNVSFNDDSKQEDNQSSFPKTPTSVSKEVFILVEDLRKSEFKGVSPKVVDLSPNVMETEPDQEQSVNLSNCENVEPDNPAPNETIQSHTEEQDKTNVSSSIVVVQDDESTAKMISANDVSGIDVLESSVNEKVVTNADKGTVAGNDSICSANQSISEGNKFSQSWSQSVRRSATKGIDEYSVRKQEEQERQEQEAKESLQMAKIDSSFKASPRAAKEQPSEKSDEEDEDEEEMEQNNEFIDDEALEVEDYQSCDSMDEEQKREMEENEIPDQGEDLGSEDTEENDDQEDDEEDNDSWVVSDGDEEQLLRSSDEDQSTQKSISPKKSNMSLRRRIVDSEEKEENESTIPFENKSSPLKSPKSTTNIRRSATPVSTLQTSGVETIEENLAKPATPTTPSKISSSPVKISSNKKQLSEPIEASSEQENETTGCSAVLFEDADEGNEKGPLSDKDVERDVSFLKSPKSIITSRKSFPADGINHTDSHIITDARKSLPASAKMQMYEKSDAIEEEKIRETDNEESKEEEVIDLEENEEVEALYEDKALNESTSSQVTLEQPVNEVSKPDRKSMPPVSLVSAQFYIGAAKKRNTVGGGETSMLTSTPKPNESSAATNKKNKSVEVKKMNASDSNSVVPNPFALANSAKLKSRASLDSGTAIKQNAKKSRLSLPTKFDEEDMPSETGTVVNGSQEPEPMEVDEVIEEAEDVTKQADDGETDDDVSVQEVVKEDATQRTTKVKPKPKALEDYDLTNILDRCNEVMREDKERKRQLASALRKKKVEKKRLRELEKQEELEAAKNAAKTSTDNNADPTNASVSTGNDSTGQGEEPTKKKKKRKPKVKNYLLEELAETKKERLEQALRHKLEVIERRKQRKKDRQLEQKKQVDKENGDSVTVTGGIGAKLEKMKKKQKAKTSDAANAAKEHGSQDPSVRVAISAFAVFNQLQNNQPLSPSIAAADGNQIQSSDNAQLVMSSGEKKQLPKPSNKKESSNEQQHSKEIAKTKKLDHAGVQETKKEARKEPVGKAIENQTEKLLTSAVAVRQALSADDVAVGKKKQNLIAQPAEPLVANSKKSPPLQQSASDGLLEDAGKMSRKQKKKQALTASSEGSENVQQNVLSITAETAPYTTDEKPKDPKKRKKEQVAELPSNGAGFDITKQEKNKKIKLNAAAAEDQIKYVQAKLSSAIGELHPAVKHVEKTKKHKKKLASQTENDAMEDGNMVELSRKKPTPTPTMPAASNAPTKKRKREQQGDCSVASTPRPAKHTKLRVLQRIESGGFFEENVTPDKVRLKRNFGFQERPATPAKQLGFKVSSILPTGQEELQSMATASKKYSKDGRKKSKFGEVVLPERNRSLPLPVWTSSGVFFESAADTNGDNSDQKKTPKEKSGYIQLKSQGGGKGEFNVKSLRPGLIAEKSHRVDPATIDGPVLNFKRQQLLEKTAHLREKKRSQRV